MKVVSRVLVLVASLAPGGALIGSTLSDRFGDVSIGGAPAGSFGRRSSLLLRAAR